MEVLRTPERRFRGLAGFPFEPHYVEVEGLRIHHVDEGPPEADPVVMLHGEPTWSYLYRHMIPELAGAGHRAVAPDLVGFGRSDKPASVEDYSYARLVRWTAGWLRGADLERVTLVCQDWGALVGLRLLAEEPGRFHRVVVANGALPTGRGGVPLAFRAWRLFARWSPVLPVGLVVQVGTRRRVGRRARAGYRAPFPSERYKAGPRALPRLVPTSPDDPGAEANRRAWDVLASWERPFLTAFSDGDPVFRGLDRTFQERVPGARTRAHTTIRGAGHFLQEDRGEALARVVREFIEATPADEAG